MTSGETRKRVLVLVLAMDAQPWRMIEDEGQRKTWAAEPHSDVPVRWLYGKTGTASTIARYVQGAVQRFAPAAYRPYSRAVGGWFAARPARTAGDRVETRVPETYLNTNPKNIAGLRHLLATEDFDYVFRTNTSSYVDLAGLEEHVQGIPATGYYAGFIGERDGTRFASGTCTLMSRDLVEYAVNDPEWEFGLIDDVAMGRCMARASVDVKPLERVDVLTAEDLAALTPESLTSAFVVRCKSSGGRGHDVEAMHRVHSLYSRSVTTQ
ncbi:hypothetical protein J2S98_001610 [Arthrobacter oryzae]|uniref:hypothetical protein n=1 Tax=Arthrobacter oryzae TaxID=409290 RepID=UPI0027867288|nr:hypothetical protein [Arthrobacter oryzae]MDP9986457.1 hypothetical protein [Arthrobacter oryzae]